MGKLELPTLGRLPNIRNVQIQTHSRCNADCFAAETLVMTPDGDKPIGDLVGKQTLLVPNGLGFGRWVEAPIRSFDVQTLWRITVSRGSALKTIRTTGGHRWLVLNEDYSQTELKTSQLQPGQRLGTCHERYINRQYLETWTVVSVHSTTEQEEVFCATVPGSEAFTLADNILTKNCLFCPYVESDHAADPGNMTDEVWHHILASLRPFTKSISTGRVCPYLMQEPLIDKTIFSKIADIYRCFPETAVEISTNGAALTDKVVDNLFTSFNGKRHDLWISHHGVNAETLEYIMKIDYKKAHANLINLLKKSDGRFKIKIRGAGTSRRGETVYFTREQYLDYWQKQFKDHHINTRNVHVDAFTFHDRAGNLKREDRGACTLNVGKVRDIGPGHPPFHCERIDSWLHFNYRGDIIICCMDYRKEINLPNVMDVFLVDYFHSKEYTNLVGMVSGLIESPDDFICARCISPGG